jgi:hypothetical protein
MADETTFSRREFYFYIWLTPLAEQNRDYGLTELRMAELCARHRVPCPPRGYWKRWPAGMAKPRMKPFASLEDQQVGGEITLKRTHRFGRPLGRRAPKAPIVVVSQPAQILAPVTVPATLPIDPHDVSRRIIIEMEQRDANDNGLLLLRVSTEPSLLMQSYGSFLDRFAWLSIPPTTRCVHAFNLDSGFSGSLKQ